MATYYFKVQCKVYNGSTVGSSVNVSQTARSLTISTARDKVIVPSGYKLRSSSPYVDTSSPSSTYGKWYNATSLSGYCEAQIAGTAGTCNIYVYVDKLPTYYTITFDANGGKIGNYDSVTRTTNSSGQVPKFPGDLTKDSTATYDYTFAGWYTKKTGGDRIYSNHTFTSDTTVYAHWKSTKREYTHYYYYMPANTSSYKLLDSFTKKVGETYTAPLFPTAAAGYEYYDYNDSGWSPESTVTIGTSDKKFYARERGKSYNAYFNTNGGTYSSVTPTNKTATFGQNFTFPNYTGSKTIDGVSSHALGWIDKLNYNNKYDFNETIKWNWASNKTFYVNWNDAQPIYFYRNRNSSDTVKVTRYYYINEKFTFLDETTATTSIMANPGYRALGFRERGNPNGTIHKFGSTITFTSGGERAYDVVWEKIYIIYFDFNGGPEDSNIKNIEVALNETVTLPKYTLIKQNIVHGEVKEQYSPSSWQIGSRMIDMHGNRQYTLTTAGNKTCTVVWHGAFTYNFSFDPTEGTWADGSTGLKYLPAKASDYYRSVWSSGTYNYNIGKPVKSGYNYTYYADDEQTVIASESRARIRKTVGRLFQGFLPEKGVQTLQTTHWSWRGGKDTSSGRNTVRNKYKAQWKDSIKYEYKSWGQLTFITEGISKKSDPISSTSWNAATSSKLTIFLGAYQPTSIPEGKQFLGWGTNKTNTSIITTFTGSASGTYSNPTQMGTLYAIFVDKGTHKVEFRGNGGVWSKGTPGEMSTWVTTWNEKYDLPLISFSSVQRKNYVLVGWKDVSSLETYHFTDKIPVLKNLTLEAQWEIAQKTMFYYNNASYTQGKDLDSDTVYAGGEFSKAITATNINRMKRCINNVETRNDKIQTLFSRSAAGDYFNNSLYTSLYNAISSLPRHGTMPAKLAINDEIGVTHLFALKKALNSAISAS